MNSIIRPSIWLPTLEREYGALRNAGPPPRRRVMVMCLKLVLTRTVFWGITTGCLAAAKNYQAVCESRCRATIPDPADSSLRCARTKASTLLSLRSDGLRFVIGFCEGTAVSLSSSSSRNTVGHRADTIFSGLVVSQARQGTKGPAARGMLMIPSNDLASELVHPIRDW
jgi:hypothetical protein